MRSVIRSLAVAAVVGIAFVAGAGGGTGRHVRAQAVKNTTRVSMVDSNVTFDAAGVEYVGQWGFSPTHVRVSKGEPIEFDNPAGNNYPHDVASISWTGMSPDRTLASGTQFASSPTRDQYMMPGGSFVLDTSPLDPGQYVYYCTIHPWMVGTFTIEPAS